MACWDPNNFPGELIVEPIGIDPMGTQYLDPSRMRVGVELFFKDPTCLAKLEKQQK